MPRLPNVCWFRQAPNAEGGGVINQKRRVSGGEREGGLVIQNHNKKSGTCMQISVVHYYCAHFLCIFTCLFSLFRVFLFMFLLVLDAKTGAGGRGRCLKRFLEGVASF